jgi:uncharacterized membrane protein YadS
MTMLSDAEISETPRDCAACLEPQSARDRKWRGLHAAGIWPGLFLTGIVAGAAFASRQIPGIATLSPMILAILIGIAFHNIVGTPPWAKAGVAFSLRRVLRAAIILLGLQLTIT